MTRGRTLLSVLACDFGVVIDRAIGAPGHGKDIVDGLNATDKIYSMLAEHGGAVGKMSHVQDPSKIKFTGLSMTAVGFEKGEHNGLLAHYHLIQLVPKKESDPDEEVEAHDEVLMSMATMAAERVQVGGYGALATEDADGYYIFKWTSEPYTQQEDVELTQFTPEARADLSREPAAGGLEEEPEAGDDAEERREALEGRGRRDPRRDPSPRGSGARGGGER